MDTQVPSGTLSVKARDLYETDNFIPCYTASYAKLSVFLSKILLFFIVSMRHTFSVGECFFFSVK